MFFQKEPKFEMDKDSANAALQSILAACHQEPNSIPFDKLLLRQEANTRPYRRWLWITAIFMLLTFVAPLFIIPLSTQVNEILEPEPVRLVDDSLEDGLLQLQFTGDLISYQSCYIEYADGTRVPPAVTDKEKQLICFPFDGSEEINIYIVLTNGTDVHYLLTPDNIR